LNLPFWGGLSLLTLGYTHNMRVRLKFIIAWYYSLCMSLFLFLCYGLSMSKEFISSQCQDLCMHKVLFPISVIVYEWVRNVFLLCNFVMFGSGLYSFSDYCLWVLRILFLLYATDYTGVRVLFLFKCNCLHMSKNLTPAKCWCLGMSKNLILYQYCNLFISRDFIPSIGYRLWMDKDFTPLCVTAMQSKDFITFLCYCVWISKDVILSLC